jgi:hypothetical protein
MRRLATLAVVAALISPAAVSGQDDSFGDWARRAQPAIIATLQAWIGTWLNLNGTCRFQYLTTKGVRPCTRQTSGQCA